MDADRIKLQNSEFKVPNRLSEQLASSREFLKFLAMAEEPLTFFLIRSKNLAKSSVTEQRNPRHCMEFCTTDDVNCTSPKKNLGKVVDFQSFVRSRGSCQLSAVVIAAATSVEAVVTITTDEDAFDQIRDMFGDIHRVPIQQ